MSAEGRRPICQDTGIVNVFLQASAWTCASRASAARIDDAVNEGVRRGYLDPDNTLRASILDDALFERKNTQ